MNKSIFAALVAVFVFAGTSHALTIAAGNYNGVNFAGTSQFAGFFNTGSTAGSYHYSNSGSSSSSVGNVSVSNTVSNVVTNTSTSSSSPTNNVVITNYYPYTPPPHPNPIPEPGTMALLGGAGVLARLRQKFLSFA